MHILKSDAPIGFFDSGVGGLTVLKKVKKIMPNESFIFYGDTLHVPYGEKSKEELLKYSANILNFFDKKGCKAVVMACNTTSSVIYDDIKDKYGFKLYPIVQSVGKIISNLPIKTLGVFATKATIESCAYQKEINKYNSEIRVLGQYCSQWVKIVENNSINSIESMAIVQNDLSKMLKNKPDKIILGCTHYPYLLNILSKFASPDMFIDPAEPFAQYIKSDLEKYELAKGVVEARFEEFYVSSSPEKFIQAAKMFYSLKSKPKLLVF